jgi:hypothetical protein
MSTRIVSVTLLSAALLSSCAPLHSDIRPEVAQPLNEARHLSGYWAPNNAAIVAKLDQAASVPNLTSDEQYKIRTTAAVVLAKAPQPIRGGGDLQSPDMRIDPTQSTSAPMGSQVQVQPTSP